MYKIQDISSFSFFFFLNFMFIINIRWMPLKKFRFFILNTDTEKNYFRDKENIVLAQKVHKVFLSCTYSFFLFLCVGGGGSWYCRKNSLSSKIRFFLLTFKKICLTTLDWDDQLQSFFLHIYCHIWYQFQHHILWLVFIFVTFSLGTAAQKKFTRKRVFKGNFV